MNICMLYQARERILNLVQNSLNSVPDIFEFFKNGHISALVENMRIEAQNLLSMFSIDQNSSRSECRNQFSY